jgi:hypothetical protein
MRDVVGQGEQSQSTFRQDGVTYDVTAELTSPTTISARVYRGVPLFGRTEILIRDPQLSFDGRC